MATTAATPRSKGRLLGWTFHGLVALAALATLYVASFPGLPFSALELELGWLVLGVLWLGWLISCIVRRSFPRALLIAPLTVFGVVGLAETGAPLTVRFAVGRPSFDRALAALPAAQESDHGAHVGTYSITRWRRVSGGGVIFYEANGDFFDDAGFAYLPHGPSESLADGSFESPQWNDLGGGWYSFTASW